jgi:hypothetical protein
MDGTMTQASLSTFMQREVNSCSGARILIKTVSAARRLPPHTYAPAPHTKDTDSGGLRVSSRTVGGCGIKTYQRCEQGKIPRAIAQGVGLISLSKFQLMGFGRSAHPDMLR